MNISRIVILYLAASAFSFAAYGIDKGAALCGSRRIPERYLHFLALVGGWPGAAVAQRIFRHKCSKASFQLRFRITAVLNCAVAVAFFLHTCR